MRVRPILFCAAIAALTGAAGSLRAVTSFPQITHITPAAIQRGRTTEITVQGQGDFFGVYKVLFQGDGITAEIVPASPKAKGSEGPRPTAVTLKVTVSPTATLGARELRLASSRGLSTIGQLVVVDEPVIALRDSPEEVVPIPVPCVVSGRLQDEDAVHSFRFHAKKGQTFTFEVICARLQDKVHDLRESTDPVLALLDAGGHELASSDDYLFADPLLTYTFGATGDYCIRVRDEDYGGDPRWVYALRVTDRPCAAYVYPMAGNPSQRVKVEPVGSARAVAARVELQAPADLGLRTVEIDLGHGQTASVPFLVSPLPQVLECEPNDCPERANRITVPCGINGRIGRDGDVDHYLFTAVKGKAVRFEVKARRFGTLLRSSLDSVLEITTLGGELLAANDDTFGKDAALEFTPPANGDYLLRVRDLTGKGGETSIYYVEVNWAQESFLLRCDPDRAAVAPGSSTPWFVHVERMGGFRGPVLVEVEGLPRGVKASALTIPPGMTQGPLVLTAAADAPRDAVNVRVVGRMAPSSPPRIATPLQEIYMPGGSRGRMEVSLQSVAVSDDSDIRAVEVVPRKVHLKPGEEVQLDVTVHRRPGFGNSISMNIILQHLGKEYANPLPRGVTVVEERSNLLPGPESKGRIVLRAAADAPPVAEVSIAVFVQVPINYLVKNTSSSPAIVLSVEK